MQKLDSSFSSYVPKQVTKEQIDRLVKGAHPESRYVKYKFSSEKIAKVCNDALLSLKPDGDGYAFKYDAENLEINPLILIHVIRDIFKAKASVGLDGAFLGKNDALRLLRPDYQKKYQFDEKESINIRKLIDSRHVCMNEAEGCIGIRLTIDDDLFYSGFNQPEIDRFFKFIDSCQLEDYTMKELLEILPIVKYFKLENMRIQVLDQIASVLDETNFTSLLKNQRAKDPDVEDLLYWYLVQNDKIDFSPFSFSDLVQLSLKIKEFKLEEMAWTGDLLEEMRKKIGQGTFSELAPSI